MHLKKLELHGYKTFAGRTDFVFNSGITAIVGPNGSGKSNLADAVRWVLGEQRISAMRAKKSEDMIFSGTERRARMGLAQAFITLDNSQGTLPLDYTEVVIGRRTYRSGENEYLLNGQRVRLRDIQELLGYVGVGTSTYTVIGQGLVDAALALRPEERRQLFEDAASLGAYQGKRDEALRRLAETEENFTRARDIIAELEPQLRRLKRQAERAEEHASLTSRLHELLRQWYGFRWGQAAQVLAASQAQAAHTANELQAANAEVESLERRIEQLKQRQQQLREQLEAERRERNRLRAESERVRRDRAVAGERARLLDRQARELAQELAQLDAEEAALAGRAAALAAEGERLQSARAEAQAALVAAEGRLSAAEREREMLRAALEQARREVARLTARRGELTQRQTQAVERRAELDQELETHRRALGDLDRRLARREGEIVVIEAELEELHQQRRALLEERDRLQGQRGQAEKHRDRCQESLHEAEKDLELLQARHELLARLRREGAGYEAGVRSLLTATEKSELKGVRGPVADHLRVPPELATAIGAALGARLQAVVTDHFAAAAEVRDWLHGQERGRALLLPLGALAGLDVGPAPTGPGIVGRAAELVETDDPGLLEYLLGDWLIVESWGVLVRLLEEQRVERKDRRFGNGQSPPILGSATIAHRPSPIARLQWNLVTLDGQVLRRDGSIEAGHGNGNGTDLLAQSREWATLPRQLSEAEVRRDRAQAALAEAIDTVHELDERLTALDREQHEVDRRIERADQALQRERRDAEKLQQEQTWRRELVARLQSEVEELERRTAGLDVEVSALDERCAAAEAAMQQAETTLEAVHPGALRETVAQTRTAVAVVDEQLAGWQRSQREQAEAAQRLHERHAAKEQQFRRLEEERATLAESSAALAAEAEQADAALAELQQRLAPLERERQAAEEEQVQLEERFAAARKKRHEREEMAHTARLALQAAEDRIAHLRDQIEADLGVVEMEEVGDQLPHQRVLPIDELVTTLPKVTVLREGLEEDVRRLRRRIAQLGAINPNAPAEYRELESRFSFLTEQSADLERASADLKQVVAELDQVMRRRFRETFDAINEAFKAYFTRLFDGGKAHLELTNPEDITTTGVEIIARPPGKRPQSIALLSGGERALTAAALIFAILKVSPAPFCVLDEVDAMLDEANVGRFRDMLTELARDTQFIVITHNRGTIEAADTIYGVSQSEKGISDVISLALDEAIRQAKH